VTQEAASAARGGGARTPSRRRSWVTGLAVVQLLALAVWAGGLLALGAVVAPIVFRTVPAPTNADAMTLVFRRFDTVAIACAAVALVAEAGFALRGGKITRLDLARAASVVVATGLAIAVGAWISPAIAELHRSGAVRGVGEGGQALARLHHLAEALAKGEITFLFASFLLSVFKAARPTP
jgi:uncharacterized membrane protein